jgi:RND family efflux transporter MFP subunit
MKKRSIWIIAIITLLLTTGGGYVAYMRYHSTQAQEPPQPTMQTGTVTRGDIVITADGSGELVPARELELTFRTGGVLDELLVETGDQVEEDDLLARLETDDLERTVAEADVELELAQLDLTDVREGPSEAELADAQAALRDAQVELQLAYDSYEDTSDSHLDDLAEKAKAQYDWYVSYYQKKKGEYENGNLSQSNHDHAMNAMISAEGRYQEALNDAEAAKVQASNRLNQARDAVYQAQEDLELLESEPLTDTLERAELAVDQALMTREEARADLEDAQLYAPFGGTVMEVTAEVGDQVSAGTSILTLADLQEPLLTFWLEESDMGNVAVGNQVNVIFEALPDYTFTGKVVRVDPVLVTVNNTPAVQSQASLNLGDQNVTLLSGMTAEVEVIAAEARDALLVPVEALNENPDGSYSVFVVDADGESEERAVEVGLQDPVNAEILSGLELGEMVRIENRE